MVKEIIQVTVISYGIEEGARTLIIVTENTINREYTVFYLINEKCKLLIF